MNDCKWFASISSTVKSVIFQAEWSAFEHYLTFCRPTLIKITCFPHSKGFAFDAKVPIDIDLDFGDSYLVFRQDSFNLSQIEGIESETFCITADLQVPSDLGFLLLQLSASR
jgi:hypothetical protein